MNANSSNLNVNFHWYCNPNCSLTILVCRWQSHPQFLQLWLVLVCVAFSTTSRCWTISHQFLYPPIPTLHMMQQNVGCARQMANEITNGKREWFYGTHMHTYIQVLWIMPTLFSQTTKALSHLTIQATLQRQKYVSVCVYVCIRKAFRPLPLFHILLLYSLIQKLTKYKKCSSIYTQHPIMTTWKQVCTNL